MLQKILNNTKISREDKIKEKRYDQLIHDYSLTKSMMGPWVFEVPSYFGQTVSFEFPRTQCDVNVEIPQWNPKAR